MDELDEILDRRFTEMLSGESLTDAEDRPGAFGTYEILGEQVTRVLVEESPRLTATRQARQLAELRARTLQKRASRRFNLPGFFRVARSAMPRWALIVAVAIIVVLIGNDITSASASSLPGSPLYSVKRFTEQGNVLLTPTAGERARVWMELASNRLDEAQRLLANEQRVDAVTLDAIDQSILNALAEVASTRGAERVALLDELSQLVVRQQSVLGHLANEALPEDRERFEQTEHLLDNVAAIAGAAQSNPAPALPASTPTGLPAASATPTDMPTHTATPSPSPTHAQIVKPSATHVAPAAVPTQESEAGPSVEPTKEATQAPTDQKNDSAEPQKSGTPDRVSDTGNASPTQDGSQPQQTDSSENPKPPSETHSPEDHKQAGD